MMIYNDTIYTDTKRLGILGINSNTKEGDGASKEGDGASKSVIYQARPVVTLFNSSRPPA